MKARLLAATLVTIAALSLPASVSSTEVQRAAQTLAADPHDIATSPGWAFTVPASQAPNSLPDKFLVQRSSPTDQLQDKWISCVTHTVLGDNSKSEGIGIAADGSETLYMDTRISQNPVTSKNILESGGMVQIRAEIG